MVVLPFCAFVGFAVGGMLGAADGWTNACRTVGAALGLVAGLSVMIKLYRIRKRADAGTSQPPKP